VAKTRFFLIIKAPNGDVREVPFSEDPVVIGRDESADVRVDDKKISRRHASFRVVDGEPTVEDLGSANGIKINGKRIDKRSKFKIGDQIKVGSFNITLKDPSESTGSSAFDDPNKSPARKPAVEKVVSKPKEAAKEPNKDMPSLTGLDDPVQGRRFELKKGENIIGRLEECDVPILDGSVSRQHSRIVFTRDRLTVTDLGSSNGTFVNDTRIDMAELAHKDRLRVGNINFDVELPERLRGRATGPVQTRARPALKHKPNERRWIVLGAVGLFMAAFVLTTTVLWKLRQQSGGARFSIESIQAIFKKKADAPDAGEAPIAVLPPPPATDPPPPATDPPPPPPPTPPIEIASMFMPVSTATSPFSRKDETGLPINLPIVPDDFDFDAFVALKLEEAKACEAKKDFGCLRAAADGLLERDPINTEARGLLDKARKVEEAEKLITKADAYEARGDYAQALQALMAIPFDVPQAEAAKKRADDLREDAIEQELARAKADMTKKRFKNAHARYKRVLDLNPSSADAIEGVRSAEKKLRAKNIDFEPYIPARPGAQEPPPPTNVQGELTAFYEGDRKLAEVAQSYSLGKVDEALKKSQTLKRTSRGDRKRRIGKMIRALEKVAPQHQKARAEISNDPAVAWGELQKLSRIEAELLPKGVKSHLVRDLEFDIGEAFGLRGDSMLESGRLEQAFSLFESGFKLDPTNPKVLAGLKRLEQKARTLVEEAELASQRGDRDACDKWKQITRIVRGDTDIHKQARARAFECR
jgi:pSer/pThr/pTyr-binding forkhead associated (FHA) protein/tetratricopeptide (TPR) repeat protein